MSKTIHDVLDEYRRLALDRRNQGDLFEYMIQTFLRTAPLYQQRFSDVWTWKDYPARGGRVDTGVDLVARDRETGELTAVQCKFYDPSHTIGKAEVDGFLAASGRRDEFSSRIFVSTTDRWGKNAEATIEGQHPPVIRLGIHDLDDSGVDWSSYSFDNPHELQQGASKQLRPYQTEAIAAVRQGLADGDRGKLIMACGTGKTFTSLRAMEEIVDRGGRVLFLVPSIALLSQTLKEWTAAASSPIRAFAVCSDVRVGKRSRDEDSADLSLTDLAYPATTDAESLVQQLARGRHADETTVVFSTYQSIGVIHEAQQQGAAPFDLVICDEAHRTTGATLTGDDESHFVRIHDDGYVAAAKRLYMTATPRIYGAEAKKAVADGAAVIASMDNESLYGPELYRLGFGEAVAGRWLTDYKVIVLAVDEKQVSRSMQSVLSNSEHEIDIPDAAKIIGCWNGLAKRSADPNDFGADRTPMKRAVAFTRSIKGSKQFAAQFDEVASELASDDRPPHCEVQHVDGGMNILERNVLLDWLREPAEAGECRILSNAKCLSEGVDVPALDAVMFLNPRNSIVDVVQSVGRVMRLSPGKEYGYVILPVAVPTDQEPEVALNDNKRFEVVWKVLQALRAHDERLDATINKLDLNRDKRANGQISIIGVNADAHSQEAWAGDGSQSSSDASAPASTAASAAAARVAGAQLAFEGFEAWEDAFYARIVKKVGRRQYWENWASDVADIARRQIDRIGALVESQDAVIAPQFARFVKGLQDNLNPSVSRGDAVEMLAQHLITKPVFDALFDNYSFSQHNPVAQVMQRMLDVLDGHNLEAETKSLEGFYDDVRVRAGGLDNAEARQHVVKELYEKFFSNAFKGTSDRLGIVYTPLEIVDFILRSVDDALRSEFGTSLSDRGVHVLDPFTGTGTFIVRLLQSGLIAEKDLPHKYRHELHANEIVLLAYYVAAINIEETYQALRGGEYVPFDGIVLTDTFQMTEDDDEYDSRGVFPENNERVRAQMERPIRVIVGNPPYSKGQDSGNDDNQNLKYPTLDRRITDTYAKRSTAQNKNNLYDSYIRAIRWASDRIGDQGIVAYVSNGGWLDGNSASGLRLTLQEEFSSVYVFNLRGNANSAGEQRRKESGGVFGEGSKTPIAIYLLVKNPKGQPGGVFYHDIGDYLSSEEKLSVIESAGSRNSLDWLRVATNEHGDWLGQRSAEFETYTPIGSKNAADVHRVRFLELYSRGIATARDAWVYNSSSSGLEANVRRMVDFYNDQVTESQSSALQGAAWSRDNDARRFSWNRADVSRLERGVRYEVDHSSIVASTYRPFSRQSLYYASELADMTYKLAAIFPTTTSENWGFYYVGVGSAVPFSVLALDVIPDLHVTGAGSGGQFFPRYRYERVHAKPGALAGLEGEGESTRIDNVTDEILTDYRRTFGHKVTKDDIFHYLYGILHSPEYRSRFEVDLKKMLPHVPKVRAFKEFAKAGERLARLHIDYEAISPFELEIDQTPGAGLRVEKMRYGKSGKQVDKSTIVYNSGITVRGIPVEAQEYMLGSRSALDWIIERYQVKTDKKSGIVNDPNDWGAEHGDPRYILDLIGRITTVSVETVKIVKSLPGLEVVA